MRHMTLPIWWWFVIPRLVLDTTYLCTKFEKTVVYSLAIPAV